MPDLADLFPGFASHWIDTTVGRIFARAGGNGPPLLLLHGYTQTNVMWHRVAPVLAKHFSLVIADLPGYGWSDVPRADEAHAPYDKRSMAKIMIEAMEKLGHVRFRLAGHDRGGRVAYRLTLDHPGRVERLATLDIVPTYDMWHGMDRNLAMKVWHWPFLAQPEPLPEMLISKATRRVSGMENGELDEGQELVCLRSSRARSLSGGICRSAAHPRPLRRLPCRTLCRSSPRRGRPRGRTNDRMPYVGLMGRRRYCVGDWRAAADLATMGSAGHRQGG